MITNITLPLEAGAASFKRLLGSVLVSTRNRPRRDAWEDSRYMLGVLKIRLTETEPEHRLLEKWDINEVDAQKGERPKGMRSGREEHRLTNKNEDDP